MAQHRLAHIGNEDVRHNPHTGHNRDVNLGMPEEPEQVLPEQGRSARVRLQLVVEHQVGGYEKARAGHVVEDEQDATRH
jgi:hypothetical protein